MPGKKSSAQTTTTQKRSAGPTKEKLTRIEPDLGEWIIWFAGCAFLSGALTRVIDKKQQGWKTVVARKLHQLVSEPLEAHEIRKHWATAHGATPVLRRVGRMSTEEFLRAYDGTRVRLFLEQRRAVVKKKFNRFRKEIQVSDEYAAADGVGAARSSSTARRRRPLSGAGATDGAGHVRSRDYDLTGLEVQQSTDASPEDAIVAAAESLTPRVSCLATRYLQDRLGVDFLYEEATLAVFRAYICMTGALHVSDQSENPFLEGGRKAVQARNEAGEQPDNGEHSEGAEEERASSGDRPEVLRRSSRRTSREEHTHTSRNGESSFDVDAYLDQSWDSEGGSGAGAGAGAGGSLRDNEGVDDGDDVDDDSDDEGEDHEPQEKRPRVLAGRARRQASKDTNTPGSGRKGKGKGVKGNGRGAVTPVRAASFTQKLEQASASRVLNIEHHVRTSAEKRLRLVQAVEVPLALLRSCIQEVHHIARSIRQPDGDLSPEDRRVQLSSALQDAQIDVAILKLPPSVVQMAYALAKDVGDDEKVDDYQLNDLAMLFASLTRDEYCTAVTMERVHQKMQDVPAAQLVNWL